MPSELCLEIRERLASVMKGKPFSSEHVDKSMVTVHVADSGEIQIFATRVPLVRAAFVLQCLNGDMDEWFKWEYERREKEEAGSSPASQAPPKETNG